MNNIPKVAHFYWGGVNFPYLRYKSLCSFGAFNPTWKIKLYVPVKLNISVPWKDEVNKVPIHTKDYMEETSRNTNIEIIPFDMKNIGFSNNLPEIIKSDIIRTYLLYNEGGLWSDSDILYFKPLTDVFENNDDKTAYFCCRYDAPSQTVARDAGWDPYHSIGLLMGAKDNTWFKLLFDSIQKNLNVKEYQSVGSLLYTKKIDMNSPDIYNIKMETVYPSRHPEYMFSKLASEMTPEEKPWTIGWHWYCGLKECGEYQNIYTEHTYKKYDNIITHLLNIINER